MSAFALRKRLLSVQADTTPAVHAAPSAVDQTIDNAALDTPTTKSQEQEAASPRRSKRTRLSRSKSSKAEEASNPISELPPAPIIPAPEKATYEDPAPSLPADSLPELRQDEVTIEASPILFSNFKPSRSNHQKRKNGKIHLKLTDGEVRYTVLRSSN